MWWLEVVCASEWFMAANTQCPKELGSLGGSESHKKGEKPGHCSSSRKEGRKITQNGRGSAGPALGVPVETRWCCSLNLFGSELFWVLN